jgi:hypothetical protein
MWLDLKTLGLWIMVVAKDLKIRLHLIDPIVIWKGPRLQLISQTITSLLIWEILSPEIKLIWQIIEKIRNLHNLKLHQTKEFMEITESHQIDLTEVYLISVAKWIFLENPKDWN